MQNGIVSKAKNRFLQKMNLKSESYPENHLKNKKTIIQFGLAELPYAKAKGPRSASLPYAKAEGPHSADLPYAKAKGPRSSGSPYAKAVGRRAFGRQMGRT